MERSRSMLVLCCCIGAVLDEELGEIEMTVEER
jgi:hypothetical protein